MGLGQRRGLSLGPAHLLQTFRSPRVRISFGLIGRPVFLPDPTSPAPSPENGRPRRGPLLHPLRLLLPPPPRRFLGVQAGGHRPHGQDGAVPLGEGPLDPGLLLLLRSISIAVVDFFPVLDFCLIGWVDGFSVQDCLARRGRPPLPDVRR